MTDSCSPDNMITVRIPDFFQGDASSHSHIIVYPTIQMQASDDGSSIDVRGLLMLTVGERKPSSSSSITLLYLASFATHFGTQIWMTFISGIVLFLNLPRKVFGLVQRHLFPKYFLLNSILGFLTLWIFVLQNPESQSQRWNLAICFVCDLMGMIYIVPDMIQTMADRAKIEEEAGVGQDVVGRFKPGELLISNPKYARLHSRFRTFHGLCALVNLLAMACNALHMYHIALKLIHR